jgi:hypothetical protein
MDWWWLLYAAGALVVLRILVPIAAAIIWPDDEPAFVSRGGDLLPAELVREPDPPKPWKGWRITVERR